MKALLRDILVTAIAAVLIFFLTQTTLQISIINGKSMEPELRDGQRVLVNKVVYSFHQPERGDIIVFYPPDPNNPDIANEEPYIKRIIGLPGEAVEIREGTVYIHENAKVQPLDEPYIEVPATQPFPEGDPIEEDKYFVLGDNRNNSDDSRSGFTVPQKNIVGKAWLTFGWEVEDWGLAPNYSFNEQMAESIP